MVGRCPAYGEDVDVPAARRDRRPARRPRLELLAGDEAAAALVRAAIGLADGAAQPGETAWAVRRLLEAPARERPLVVVVEDVHWAEPTLLDLLEYLARLLEPGHADPARLPRAPRAAASAGRRGRRRGPSTRRSCSTRSATPRRGALVAHAVGLGGDVAARIVERAEGNPLFLEQLAAVGAEDARRALPASIQAVLAARIDRLDPGERALLEHASVQGRSFHAGALEARTRTSRGSLVGPRRASS